MTTPPLQPGITILHGDDALTIEETLAAWYRGLGDPSMADLNTTRLDGKTVSDNDLRTATDAMPFLTERRLVILRGLNTQRYANSEANRTRFLDQIGRIPPTTSLVIVLDDHPGRKGEWEVLKPTHWLRKWAEGHAETARILPAPLPQPAEMRKWVLERARSLKGQFTPQAADQLVGLIGSDTAVASQEIRKLLDYVDYRRAVEPDDVVHLVTQSAVETNVFDLTDALGNRQGQRAQKTAQQMLGDQDALSLLGMVTRHFRLLLVVREVIDEGGWADQVVSQLSKEPFRVSNKFYADKLCAQARAFPLARLKDIYRRLLRMDEALKTSEMDGRTAFAVFIAELTES